MAEAAQWMQDQLREYVLHYFMRVSDFRQPQGITEEAQPVSTTLLAAIQSVSAGRSAARRLRFLPALL